MRIVRMGGHDPCISPKRIYHAICTRYRRVHKKKVLVARVSNFLRKDILACSQSLSMWKNKVLGTHYTIRDSVHRIHDTRDKSFEKVLQTQDDDHKRSQSVVGKVPRRGIHKARLHSQKTAYPMAIRISCGSRTHWNGGRTKGRPDCSRNLQ